MGKYIKSMKRTPRQPKIKCKCVWCGKDFLAKSSKTMYCSISCRDKAKYRREVERQGTTKICACCGEEFVPKYATTKTCSKECHDELLSIGSSLADPNRPFTNETVYIVKLWNSLGDSPSRIAMILTRPVAVIEGILRGDYDV